MDWELAGGHFFTQSNGRASGTSTLGFPVTNDEGIPFWDTWQSLGSDNMGYPVSGRFVWNGFPTQVFQKAVFQWQPGRGLFFLNVFDLLHDRCLDPVLQSRRSTPPQLESSFDAGKSLDQIASDRLALLDANPAIKARYFAAPDPLLQFGLPGSRVEDLGNALVLRTQRAVFQQWKVDVPWAAAGQVTVANGGDVAKELGLFPAEPLAPVRPPLPVSAVPGP